MFEDLDEVCNAIDRLEGKAPLKDLGHKNDIGRNSVPEAPQPEDAVQTCAPSRPTLSLEAALQLQRELYEGFANKDFQAELRELEEQHGKGYEGYGGEAERTALYLTVQSAILPKYGFEGSQAGVVAMLEAASCHNTNEEFRENRRMLNQLLGLEPTGEELSRRVGAAKGKGKGKGKGKDGPPSSSELSEATRAGLRAQLEAFMEGPETQLAMPPTITGLERKFLHEVSQELGLTSQSFGQGRDRYLCIFKSGTSVPSEGAAGDASPAAEEPEDTSGGRIFYSAVVLSEESKERLRSLCATAFKGGIPSSWTTHCEHMTICMGPLTRPLTEDSRSVADSIRQQTAALRERQEVELRVVSTGSDEQVLAVGVVGCTSCSRNPHITVATAPDAPPSRSNLIRKWNMLPVEEQLCLRGMVWQRGPERAEVPPAWSWAPQQGANTSETAAGQEAAAQAALAAEALACAVRLSRAFLRGERGGRPRTVDALRGVLVRRAIPRSLYAVHPAKLASALGEALPGAEEAVRYLELCLAAPPADPLQLFSAAGGAVPGAALQRVRRDLARLLGQGKLGQRACGPWLVSQAACPVDVDVEAVVQGLKEAGAINLGEDGAVQYLALGDESKAEARNKAAYLLPWPLKSADEAAAGGKWEIELERGWQEFDEVTTKLINKTLKAGSKTVEYSARRQQYTLDLTAMQQENQATGVARAIRPVA